MGVKILYDEENNLACFYSSVTGMALGPVIDGLDYFAKNILEDFADYIGWEVLNKLSSNDLCNEFYKWVEMEEDGVEEDG